MSPWHGMPATQVDIVQIDALRLQPFHCCSAIVYERVDKFSVVCIVARCHSISKAQVEVVL